MPLGISARSKNRAERGNNSQFFNPKGIMSFSPGLLAPWDKSLERPGVLNLPILRGEERATLGRLREWFPTPTGLRHASDDEPQPRWGSLLSPTIPRVARSSPTLGFVPESLWDSSLEFRNALRSISINGLLLFPWRSGACLFGAESG